MEIRIHLRQNRSIFQLWTKIKKDRILKENEFNTLASKLYISKLEAYSNGFKKSLIVDKEKLADEAIEEANIFLRAIRKYEDTCSQV